MLLNTKYLQIYNVPNYIKGAGGVSNDTNFPNLKVPNRGRGRGGQRSFGPYPI